MGKSACRSIINVGKLLHVQSGQKKLGELEDSMEPVMLTAGLVGFDFIFLRGGRISSSSGWP